MIAASYAKGFSYISKDGKQVVVYEVCVVAEKYPQRIEFDHPQGTGFAWPGVCDDVFVRLSMTQSVLHGSDVKRENGGDGIIRSSAPHIAAFSFPMRSDGVHVFKTIKAIKNCCYYYTTTNGDAPFDIAPIEETRLNVSELPFGMSPEMTHVAHMVNEDLFGLPPEMVFQIGELGNGREFVGPDGCRLSDYTSLRMVTFDPHGVHVVPIIAGRYLLTKDKDGDKVIALKGKRCVFVDADGYIKMIDDYGEPEERAYKINLKNVIPETFLIPVEQL